MEHLDFIWRVGKCPEIVPLSFFLFSFFKKGNYFHIKYCFFPALLFLESERKKKKTSRNPLYEPCVTFPHAPYTPACVCVGVCLSCVFVPASCARASLTLHSPVELLFPDSTRTIRRGDKGESAITASRQHFVKLPSSFHRSGFTTLPASPFFLKTKTARFPRWRMGRYGFNHLQTRHAVSFSAKVLTCQRCAPRA